MCCDVFLNGRKWLVAQIGSVNLTVNEWNYAGYHQDFQELDGHDAFYASPVAVMDETFLGFGSEHVNLAICRRLF